MNATTRAIPFVTSDDVGAAVGRATRHLRENQLLAYPTETVYGLGSSIDPTAVEQLAALKERDRNKPFLVLIAGLHMLDDLALRLTTHATRLMEQFWPGPLTLVLASTRLPASRFLRGAEGAVAVRWTAHPGVQRVVTALGAPITSTSANGRGLPPATTAQEIAVLWGRAVESGELLVLDGGWLAGGTPSTVVDCSHGPPRVLREGAIGAGALRNVVPDLIGDL